MKPEWLLIIQFTPFLMSDLIQVDPDADELFAVLIVFTDAGGANTEHKFVLTLHLPDLCSCCK